MTMIILWPIVSIFVQAGVFVAGRCSTFLDLFPSPSFLRPHPRPQFFLPYVYPLHHPSSFAQFSFSSHCFHFLASPALSPPPLARHSPPHPTPRPRLHSCMSALVLTTPMPSTPSLAGMLMFYFFAYAYIGSDKNEDWVGILLVFGEVCAIMWLLEVCTSHCAHSTR